MTNEEKNEVLAKWAGFTWDGFWIDPNGFTFGAPWPGPDEAIKESDWKVITGPDLLHSLDVQAKWLWLEVVRRFSAKKLHIILDLWVHDALTKGEIPKPEACAEAILSLVGEQVPA